MTATFAQAQEKKAQEEPVVVKSIADYQKVFESTKDKSERELALYRMIELHLDRKEYKKAADMAELFLDGTKGFPRSPRAGFVRYDLGRAQEGCGKTTDALRSYVITWVGYKGQISASAPAMERWMTLMWARNKPGKGGVMSDRQGAYEGGANYIKSTSSVKGKFTKSDLKLWLRVEKLVKQYEAAPNIKTLRQQEDEKKPW